MGFKGKGGEESNYTERIGLESRRGVGVVHEGAYAIVEYAKHVLDMSIILRGVGAGETKGRHVGGEEDADTYIIEFFVVVSLEIKHEMR